MFRKLFRYEFRQSARFGVWLILGMAIVSLLAGITMFFLARSTYEPSTTVGMNPADFASFLLVVLLLLLVFGGVAACFILLVIRFYKSMAGDEAYLTFTLPVTEKDILLSKILNAFLWLFFVMAALVFFFLCLLGGSALGHTVFGGEAGTALTREILFEIRSFFFSLFHQEGGAALSASIILEVVRFLLTPFTAIVIVFFVITWVGTFATKHKILYTVLILLGLSLAENLLRNILSFGSAFFLDNAEETAYLVVSLVAAALSLAVEICLALLGFFLGKRLLERKLNVE